MLILLAQKVSERFSLFQKTVVEIDGQQLKIRNLEKAVSDPGFSIGGGTNSKGGCERLFFGQFFPTNCMKLKEFGLKAAACP